MTVVVDVQSVPPPDIAAGHERIPVGDRVTIFRTPASPRWYAQFSLEGRQYRHSLKTTSKKRALELAKKKDAQLVLGQAEPRPRPRSRSLRLRSSICSRWLPAARA